MKTTFAYLFSVVLLSAALLTIDVMAGDHTAGHTGDGSLIGGVSGGGSITSGILYCERAQDDSLPMVCYFQGADSYEQSTGANQTGGDIVQCGGIGIRSFVIDAFGNCAGDTVTWTIDGVANVLTEGVDWNAGASDAEAATSLAAASNGLTGVDFSYSSGANVYTVLEPETCSVDLAESDATCTSFLQGNDGQILIMEGTTARPAIAFLADTDTGIKFSNRLEFVSNGIIGGYFLNNDLFIIDVIESQGSGVQVPATGFIRTTTRGGFRWNTNGQARLSDSANTTGFSLDCNDIADTFVLKDLAGTGKGGLMVGISTVTGTVIDAAPAQPHACNATYEGAELYVDDTNDTAWGRKCICANLDGTGYDWRDAGDIVGTACPFF